MGVKLIIWRKKYTGITIVHIFRYWSRDLVTPVCGIFSLKIPNHFNFLANSHYAPFLCAIIYYQICCTQKRMFYLLFQDKHNIAVILSPRVVFNIYKKRVQWFCQYNDSKICTVSCKPSYNLILGMESLESCIYIYIFFLGGGHSEAASGRHFWKNIFSLKDLKTAEKGLKGRHFPG